MIRHGETDWNIERRYQGSADTPLNTTGREQAQKLSAHLDSSVYDAIYSSDMVRVQETARLALADSSLHVELDERLRELSFGKFEGLTYDEIQEQFPDELAQWEANRDDNTHGGERLSAVIARARDFLDDTHTHHEGQRLLVFGHGGILGMLLAMALGAPPEKWWQFRLENTSVSEIALYEDGAVLLRFNDTRHLE